MLESAILAWLVATLGDQALKGLKVIVVGKPERIALTAAMRVACLALLSEAPPDARQDLEHTLAESFRKPPEMVFDGRTSVKSALTAAVVAQVSPLLDRTAAQDGRSYFDRLGMDGGRICADLPGIVIASIQEVGPGHPALLPLVSQLNADITQERIDEVLRAVQALMLPPSAAASAAYPRSGARPRPGATPADLLEPVLDAILGVPSMGDYGARMTIISSLSPRVRDAIPRSPVARIDTLNTIRTCQNYSGGMQELVAAIRVIERDSEPMRDLDAAILALADDEAIGREFETRPNS